jgi:hypothetical protein
MARWQNLTRGLRRTAGLVALVGVVGCGGATEPEPVPPNRVPVAFNVALDSSVRVGQDARFVGACSGGDAPVTGSWSPASC